jgi:hypothetical protein
MRVYTKDLGGLGVCKAVLADSTPNHVYKRIA